jgi:hypothetical protein
LNRRPLGRGRLLIGIGAIVTVFGLLPLWWMIPRTNDAALSGNGLQGPGIIIFLSCMAMLAALVLPFTSRDRDSSLDRPLTYVALALLAVSAYLFRLYEIAGFATLRLPTEAPGLWITGAGLVLVAWGTAEVLTEKPSIY